MVWKHLLFRFIFITWSYDIIVNNFIGSRRGRKGAEGRVIVIHCRFMCMWNYGLWWLLLIDFLMCFWNISLIVIDRWQSRVGVYIWLTINATYRRSMRDKENLLLINFKNYLRERERLWVLRTRITSSILKNNILVCPQSFLYLSNSNRIGLKLLSFFLQRS